MLYINNNKNNERSNMKRILLLGVIAAALTGCAGQNYYGATQQMPTIQNNGTVLSVQHYQTQNRDPSVLGGVIGAAGGTAIGSVMGGGTGKIATMIAGAVVGGYAGSQLGATSTSNDMVNMSIALDNGATITVSYQDKGFYTGQRVSVQQQGSNYMVYPIR